MLKRLQTTLYIQSLSIYIGILFIIIFLKNLHQNNRRLSYKILILIQSLLQTILFQFIFIICALYIKYLDKTQQFKDCLEIVYIRALFLFSAISSMPPIMQVLLEQPLNNFKSSIRMIKQPFIKDIKFKSVLQMKQIQTDEELAKLNNSESDSMLIFEDIEDNGDIKISDLCKHYVIICIQSIWNVMQLLGRSLSLIYNTIQLIMAFVLIFGFICIFIQYIDPNSDLLSQLNAIDFFSNQLDQNSQESKMKQIQFQMVEVITIAIFKFVFIIIMYFGTNNRIQYSKNRQLIDNVTNLTVIIRKNLLNFTLIGLLTTLYPNLTFTINNSNCFKEIQYRDGYLIKMGQVISMNEQQNCPITLTYLISLQIFESQITTTIGLLILLFYLFTAFYILCLKRKNKNLNEI
ncbi:unnamed protein product [Paramecium octaurelia]|uniref:Transmembrane protein n=1 Tax=Paramecium octaurelia TaxID=43137 RepID=A0A8S1SQC0_PAROT|nr:unnamed protein product [Paramecium octaurelia]